MSLDSGFRSALKGLPCPLASQWFICVKVQVDPSLHSCELDGDL
ncbi:hypothetical protein SAMN04487983_10711 [Streptomyces sp. yr375]|nr:hypothetical protein SAMN04487983_10711 [Streptomyces sp. yr375]